MEILAIVTLIIGVGILGATVILSALRHSHLYGSPGFARAAWVTIVLWSSLTVTSSLLPLDYWHNPPFQEMIRIPKDADIVSCYKLVLGKTEPFGNPWAKGQSVFGSSWFSRRGLGGLFSKTIGNIDPELNALASQRDGIDAICVYIDAGTQRAVIMERSGGGSSGDNFLTLRLFEKRNNAWSEVKRQEHNRSNLDDLSSRFAMTAAFGLAFLVLLTVAPPLCSRCSSEQRQYLAPLRYLTSMIPAYVLCVLAVATVVWTIVPSMLDGALASIPALCFLMPVGCVVIAYILYRVVSWREKVLCSNTASHDTLASSRS